MNRKSLFINGIESFRIDNNKYYISDSDDEVLLEVNKEDFRKELLKCDWILDSWDETLKAEFKLLLSLV